MRDGEFRSAPFRFERDHGARRPAIGDTFHRIGPGGQGVRERANARIVADQSDVFRSGLQCLGHRALQHFLRGMIKAPWGSSIAALGKRWAMARQVSSVRRDGGN